MSAWDVLLATCAETVEAVSATRSKKAKCSLIAATLTKCETDRERAVVASWFAGQVPQRRLGVGWSSLYRSGDPVIGLASAASLAVTHVDDVFEALAGASGEGSQKARAELIANLFAAATPCEGTLLIGLLSGEVRSGALGGIVLDAIAVAFDAAPELVRRAHLLTGDLGATAVLAHGGNEALADVRLQVGRGIQPMLASTAADLATAMPVAGGDVSVEWKLDGARIQLHRDGDEVWIYTRNLNDITHRLPDVVAIARAFPAHTVVLDGEILGLYEDGAPRAFQHTIANFATDTAATSAPRQAESMLRPFFFDCMHCDGVDLLESPLHERLEVLDRVVGEHRVPRIITASLDDALVLQTDALDRGHEGVMVKDATSTYEAGRRGATWRKVKPVRTFDLVVLAAEWGHGRRVGWLSNLHLGARDPETDSFVMVGKTFKGLTDVLLRWQTEELLAREVRRTGGDTGTVWVRPELMVEIAIDGVQHSTRYPGGVALRFARVKRYRDDKVASDADTLTSLRGLLI